MMRDAGDKGEGMLFQRHRVRRSLAYARWARSSSIHADR